MADKIRMMYIGTHVTNIQDSMRLIFKACENAGIEPYWGADFSGFKGDMGEIPATVCQVDFRRHPLLSRNNFKAIGQLREYIRKYDIQMLHCNTPIGSFCGRIAGKKENVQLVVYTAHGLPFFKGAPKWRVAFKWLEHYLARYTDYGIVMNREDYTAMKQMKFRKDKIFTIDGVGVPLKSADPSVREAKRNELGLADDTVAVICVGRLEKVKGVDTTIKAFSRMENKNAVLMICGQGYEEESLKVVAKESGAEDHIKFMGFRNDVPDLLEASDIYILTSYYEGLPRSLMEAMNAGLASVVSDARGNSDLIENGKNGLVVKPGNAEDTAKALDVLAGDAEMRQKMAAQAKEDVKKCSFENVLKEYTDIYLEVTKDIRS